MTRQATRVGLAIALLSLFWAGPLHAMDLFVAAGGDDSIARGANDINHPWLTVSKAFLAAEAGDTVYFRGGTYYVTSTIYTINGNDGTALAPITFRNYPGENVTISGDCGGRSVLMLEQNYIYLEGLNFVGQNLSNEAAIIYVADTTDATNFRATNCTFRIASSNSVDNVSCVRFQATRARNGAIRRCRFVGPGRNNGVQIFRTTGMVVEHSEFSSLEAGIHFKHSNTLADTGIRFSYNYFHDCTKAGILGVMNYATISHNLLVNCPISIGSDGGVGDGYVGADYNTITHNTLFNDSLDLIYETRLEDPNKGCLHNVIRNNIFMTTCPWHQYSDLAADIRSDYNLYAEVVAVAQNRVNYSLANWRTRNGTDAHSVAGRPAFIGGSGISAYALAVGSVGKGAADDGTDIGAQIELVGVGSGASPSRPGGVRIY